MLKPVKSICWQCLKTVMKDRPAGPPYYEGYVLSVETGHCIIDQHGEPTPCQLYVDVPPWCLYSAEQVVSQKPPRTTRRSG